MCESVNIPVFTSMSPVALEHNIRREKEIRRSLKEIREVKKQLTEAIELLSRQECRMLHELDETSLF